MENPFRKAKDNIRGHWFQGDYMDELGGYCAAGHMILGMGFTPEDIASGNWTDEETDRETTILNKVASEQFPERGNVIAHVNDHKDTTEDDIVMLFEKAAVIWDEQVV